MIARSRQAGAPRHPRTHGAAGPTKATRRQRAFCDFPERDYATFWACPLAGPGARRNSAPSRSASRPSGDAPSREQNRAVR